MRDFLDGRTVLLTGATGFIGRHLLRRLVADGAHVVALTRRPLPASSPLREGGVLWVESHLHDLTVGSWRGAGVDRVDVVLHLGGHMARSHAEADSIADVYDGILLGTRALLDSLPTVPDRVVFTSTIDVYAPSDRLTERSALGPTTLYGSAKLFCERLVQVWAAQVGAAAVVLRYGHITGPGGEAFSKLIPMTIRQLRRGEPPTLYGDGSAERDFLYVGDAVEATVRAATVAPPGAVVNIARGESTSIRTVAEMLRELTGASVPLTYLEDKPAGRSIRFDTAHMRDVLGEWPLVPLRETLAREVAAYTDVPDAAP